MYIDPRDEMKQVEMSCEFWSLLVFQKRIHLTIKFILPIGEQVRLALCFSFTDYKAGILVKKFIPDFYNL